MWTEETYQQFWKEFSKNGEENYIQFSQKIIKTKYKMLGIRIPLLRKQVKKIQNEEVLQYLKVAKDTTYEEVLMQGILLGNLKEKVLLEKALSSFLPKIDNWAICDITVSSLKLIAREKEYFLKRIDTYLESVSIYTIRVGLVLLLTYYVDEDFLEEIFKRILQIKNQSYPVSMALSWLLCECFITNQEKTFSFLKEAHLSSFVLSKTISKIQDSYRITKEDKEKVVALRRKGNAFSSKKKEFYS